MPQFTERDLAQYERAARIYCNRLGLDPDDHIEVPNPAGLVGVATTTLRWKQAAEQMILFSVMMVSMREAAVLAQPANIFAPR